MEEDLLQITAEESGERIDALLARILPELSRSAAQRLLEEGRVLLAGRPVKKNYKCAAGDLFTVSLPEAAEDVLPGAGRIHRGDKDRFQAQVAEILGNIPADAAVDIPDLSGVPASGYIVGGRISLDIHKDSPDNGNAHMLFSFRIHAAGCGRPSVSPSYHRKRMKNNRKTT